MLLAVEESHAVPLVDVELVLGTGTVHDPEGREGTTRLTWRTIRMGTRRLRGPELEEAVARLGARLSIDVSTSYVRVHAGVIRRNLEPLLELLGHVLTEPAFRADDVAQVKRETRADLVAIRDNDRALAGRWLRRSLFLRHAYGRSVVGSPRTLAAIRPSDLRDLWSAHCLLDNAIVGMAGDVRPDEARALVDRTIGRLRRGKVPREHVGEPRLPKGRRIVVVDKPERVQTQVYVGALGVAAGDPRFWALAVANTAFGGTFTAKLMQEVREKRGWSYGAYSRFGQDRARDAWTMWTHPAATDAAACIALELDLLERFVAKGASAKDHAFAKRYLARSHCFDLDTAYKRLEPTIEAAVFDLPSGYYDDYEKKMLGVTPLASKKAVGEVLSADDLVIALTATAKDVVPALEKLPGVKSVEIVPYDTD